MKRRWVILVAIAAVLLGGIAVTQILFREPSYQGRSVSAWLDQFIELDPSRPTQRIQWNNQDQEKREQAFNALQKMGVDGLPYVLRRTGQGESRWRNKYAEWRPKFPRWLQRHLPQPKEPLDPNSAGAILSGIGPAALPQSIEALKDSNSLIREAGASAIFSLAAGTNNVKSAVPGLTQAVGDGDVRVRLYAAGALGKLGPDAASAAPALAAALQGNDVGPKPGQRTYARAWAATALGKIGPGAKSALPALRVLLQDPDAYVHAQAAVAIWRIDADVDATLPVLLQELPKANVNSKWEWIDAMAEMGPRATNAFPVLVKELKGATPYNREKLTNALFKIDPAAAAKMKF